MKTKVVTETGAVIDLPEFSTNLDASTLVVQKMASYGWKVFYKPAPRGTIVSFVKDGRTCSYESESVPEAICRAALLTFDQTP